MTGHSVSVVIVSRNRPDALVRCLTGIEQLDHDHFEVIVVSDQAGIARLSQAGFGGRIKSVPFDEPNISAARNHGLGVAGGEVVAFIDDDAVPEPTWLTHLAAAFDRADVAAAGGYVIGRNGITFQHRGRRVDGHGKHTAIELPDNSPVVFDAFPGDAVKTEGTNCAFRASVLREIGGFDPAFRFYLDETDVNLRIAARRLRTAIVPLAQVHHGFEASDRRLASRMPTSLLDIGASQAIFLRKHAPSEVEAGLAVIRDEQRRRLLRFMVAGLCEPGDVQRLLRTLDAGISEGRDRRINDQAAIAAPRPGFLRFEGRTAFSGMKVVSGRVWSAVRLRQRAVAELKLGQRVSLYLFSPTLLYHSASFRQEGYWVQSGGLFGRSRRDASLFRWTSFARRVQEETARVADVRHCRKPEPKVSAPDLSGDMS